VSVVLVRVEVVVVVVVMVLLVVFVPVVVVIIVVYGLPAVLETPDKQVAINCCNPLIPVEAPKLAKPFPWEQSKAKEVVPVVMPKGGEIYPLEQVTES